MVRTGFLAWLALTLACCGGKPSPSSSVPAAYRGSSPALNTSPALAYLHQDTAFVAVASNPSALDRTTGWAQLTLLGQNHLPDIAELSRAGIATERPAGLALVDPVHQTWVAFATIADRKRLEAWVATRAQGAGGMARPSRAGDATIYLPSHGGGSATVLRGDQALFLWTRGAKSVRDLAAVRLAALQRPDSILETSDYQHLVPRLGFGRDLAIFVSSSWLTVGDTSDVDKAMVLEERVAEALRAAREQKAQPDQLAAMERQLAMVRQIAAAAGKAERFRLDLGRQLGPLVIGAELQDDQLRIAAVAAPSADSAVSRLLPGTRLPHPVAAAIAKPAFVASAHVEPAALLELIGAWLSSRGSSLDRLRKATADLGADLDRALLSNMSGELTFAISGGRARALDVTVGIKVVDPASARALVLKLAQSPAAHADSSADNANNADNPTAIIEAAGLSAPLRILVAGGYLIASTLPALAKEPPADPRPGTAARLILAGWMALGGSAPPPPPPRLVSFAPDAHRAPPSDEYLGLRGKLDSARARVEVLTHEDELATARHRRELGSIVGRLELEVEPDGKLYRAFGRLSSEGQGISAVAGKLSDATRREARKAEKREDELAAHSSRIDALARELDRLRKRDIAAWQNAHPPQ